MPKKLVYVGQTYLTAFQRFKAHTGQAMSMLKGRGTFDSQEAFWLYRYIARNGIDKLCVVPLETIKWNGKRPPDEQSAKTDDWKIPAMQAERRWIQWLGCKYPVGYNKSMPGTKAKTFSQVIPEHGLWQALPYVYTEHADSASYQSRPSRHQPYQCRDYHRRIQALARDIVALTTEQLAQHMRRYRPRNLTRMHEISKTHRLIQLSEDSQQLVTDTIAVELHSRRQAGRRKQGPRPLITPYFSNWILDELPLHDIVAKDDVAVLLPLRLRNKQVNPMVGFKNPATLGQKWCNYASLFDGSTLSYDRLRQKAEHEPCVCHRYPPQFKPHGHDGHVLTSDPQFLAYDHSHLPDLPKLMKEGRKYRPPKSTTVDIHSKGVARTHVQQALESFAERQNRDYKIHDREAFRPWINRVLHHVDLALADLPNGTQLAHHGAPKYGRGEEAAMCSILQDFLCTYCDKSANNFSFICKKHAIKSVLDDMHRGAATMDSTYQRLDTLPEAIIRSLLPQISRVGKSPEHNCLPVISLLPKMHKDTIGWRFLSLSFKNFMRPSAVLLTRALRALHPDMYKLWHRLNFPSAGGWNCWVLSDSAAFMPTIHAYNAGHTVEQHDTPPNLHQFDFERLYTELDQADLIAKLHQFVDLAFGLHPGHVLKISNRAKHNAKWVKLGDVPANPTNKESYMSSSQIKDLIMLVVNHAYATVGGAVFKQVKGIPMGVNPAGFFANIYLFMYERQFFQNLLVLNTPASRRALRAFRFCGRLIDDVDIITSETKAYVQQYFYCNQMVDGIAGIYPPSLNLQDSSCSNPHHSNFLDLHIQPVAGDRGPLATTLFDKREQPEFRRRLKTIRFPAPYSMISKRCKLNVFDSQFIRYARLITQVDPFIDSVARLMHELICKGYDAGQIMKRCRFQVRDHPHLYGTSPGIACRFRHARGLLHAIQQRLETIMCASPVGE